MYNFAVPKLKKGDKVIIGLGDSFTQGLGAYTDATWKKHEYNIPIYTNDKKLIAEQYQGSWVNQICQTYLDDYIPVNFGQAGIGNRGALKQIYLNTRVDLSLADEVIVVYMLTGLERFDFVKKNYGAEEHYAFQTMWPNPQDSGATHPDLWQAYEKNIYSNEFMAGELILNILDAQTYCQAHNYKLIITNGFDARANKDWLSKTLGSNIPILGREHKKLIDKIDWNNFLYPKGHKSFLHYLLELEGMSHLGGGGWWTHYSQLTKPSEYITNCVHPTHKGQSIIAKEIYEFINAN